MFSFYRFYVIDEILNENRGSNKRNYAVNGIFEKYNNWC